MAAQGASLEPAVCWLTLSFWIHPFSMFIDPEFKVATMNYFCTINTVLDEKKMGLDGLVE